MRHVAICFALLFAASSVFAQTGSTGDIQGTVTDPSGAVVVGAAVDATTGATGTKTDTETTDTGFFVIPLLQPGVYTVTVTAPGFESTKQEHVTVDALQTVTLNPKLQLGSATQYVTVSSQPTMLQADDQKLGGDVENNVFDSLPLAMANNQARDPGYFSNLVSGVTDSGFQSSGTDLNSYNGGQQFQNEIYVEGLALTSIGTGGDTRNVSFGMSVEAIEQFQVVTSGGEAMYDGQGESNFVIKSGTNQFHGGLFEYFRNTVFDARNFFQTIAPLEHQNEFGGTVGGPIRKNKLFFFGSYDGYRFETDIAPASDTIPTAAEQTGDFSQAGLVPIYNNSIPCTTGTGCTPIGTQFVCPATSTNVANRGKLNIIPGSPACPVTGLADPVSAVSQYLASALPTPTNTAIENNYLAQGLLSKTIQDTTTEKVDYNLNDKNRLFFVYSYGRYLQPGTGSFTAGTSELPPPYLQARSNQEFVNTAQIHETYTISPTLVNDIGIQFSRLLVPEMNITAAGDWPTKAGLTGLPSGIASTAFPIVNFADSYQPMPVSTATTSSWAGTNANASTEAQNTYTVQDNVLWTKNRNHFTFGFQYQALEDNDNNPLTGSLATFNFSVNETACVNVACGSSGQGTVLTHTGNAFASYLLGEVDSSSVVEDTVAETGGRYHDYAPYAQDDIKVNSRLTVNLGLRWDIWSPYNEAFNRMSFFNPTLTNPVVGLPGALQFAGSGADSCGCATPVSWDFKNFGPRVGFAYRVGSNTVVRGFYGIFYAHAGGVGGRTDGRQGLLLIGDNGTASASSTVGGDPAYNWGSAAIGGTNGVIPGGALNPPFINPSYGIGFISASAPGAAAIGAGPGTAQTLNYADAHESGIPPSYQDISLGIQHSFTPNMTLGVSYSGSLGHHLAGAGVAGPLTDQIPLKYLPLQGLLGSTLTVANEMSAYAILNPLGIAPSWMNAAGTGVPFAFYSGTVGQSLKPFPQYSSISDPWIDVGNSAYNSLQVTFNRRTSHGLTFMANYTFSKELDDLAGVRLPGDDDLERAPGAIDRPEVASATIVWQPLAPGHSVAHLDRAASAIVSGWLFSGIYTFASGAPLSVTGACTGGSIIDASCYPNLTPGFTGPVWQGGTPGTGGVNPATTHFLNSAAFTEPAAYTYGDAARMAPYNLYAPNIWDLDVSVRRVFAIHEQMSFAIQCDAFNVLNIVNFGAPNTTLSSSSFGEITTQANNPRKLQFSGRFTF
jgi:hypothetical protein